MESLGPTVGGGRIVLASSLSTSSSLMEYLGTPIRLRGSWTSSAGMMVEGAFEALWCCCWCLWRLGGAKELTMLSGASETRAL
jgi:hypothetical protein